MPDDEDIYFRDEEVCGVKGWHWVRGDTGAWTGPGREFQPLATLCMQHVRGKDLVLTAGACCGMYPRLWSRYFKRVVGVEPDPLNFTAFNLNCVGDQYTKVCAALGDVEGTARLNLYGRANVGMHSLSRPNQSEESFEVRVVTVDSLDLPALDLMQLDVEGYEMRVLLGADSTIRKYQPVISVESLTPDIHTLFEAHGYKKIGGSAADTVFAPR